MKVAGSVGNKTTREDFVEAFKNGKVSGQTKKEAINMEILRMYQYYLDQTEIKKKL